jgi:5-formyltetrahydrofolate cyclo-ligase
VNTSKAEVRRSLLAARRALPADLGLLDAARATAEVRRAGRVALYVALGPEPQTAELIAWLLSEGKEVLLPILHPDNDLGWGLASTVEDLLTGRLGLSEPSTDLGSDAIATADLVICPALAVDRRGMRLGRGGGSYDRALARVPVGVPIWAAVYDNEILDRVPVDPHDRSVDGALTPSGLIRLR